MAPKRPARVAWSKRKQIRPLPQRQCDLTVANGAVVELLQALGYPLAPPEFDRTVGTCYWNVGCARREDDDDDA